MPSAIYKKVGCHCCGKALRVSRVPYHGFRDHVQLRKAPVARSFATVDHHPPFYSVIERGLVKLLIFSANACRQRSKLEQYKMFHLNYCLTGETGKFRNRKNVTLVKTEDQFFPKMVTKMNCPLYDKYDLWLREGNRKPVIEMIKRKVLCKSLNATDLWKCYLFF